MFVELFIIIYKNMNIVLVLIVLIILLFFWIIGTQRQLVVLDENINNAMSQIGVQVTSRFDALTSLLDLVKGYNEHEYKTLMAVISQRGSINGQSKSTDVESEQNLISNVVSRILAVAESYPELKSNTNYQNLMNNLNEYEDKVRKARLIYNDTVTKLNRIIRMFPTNLIAPVLGIAQRDYLKAEESKQQMPSMK